MIIPCLLALTMAANGLFAAAGETSAVQVVTPMINIGVAGVMLWWFMSRTEPRLKSIEEKQHEANLANQESMDRVARSVLLLVISSGLRPIQEQSNSIMEELDTAAEERKRATEAKK